MSILDEIREYKLKEAAQAEAEKSLSEIEEEARSAEHPRGFLEKLREATRTGYGLIAEIKKASPSKGLIRENFDPARLANAYAAGGAACLSVLTDGPSFQGSPEALRAARKAVELPVLRKDFMFTPYQIVQSRAMEADCILLIMAALDLSQAIELEALAFELGMDVLIEVHSEEELEQATNLKSPLIGINNRDLHSFETSLDVTKKIARLIPPDRLIVSESGIYRPEDLADLARYGARAFLIGESLMRQEDVENATRELLAHPVIMQGGL